MTRRPRRVRVRVCAGFAVLLLLPLVTPAARAGNPSDNSPGPTCRVTGQAVGHSGAAVGRARVPLFTRHPGFDTFDARGSFRSGERPSVTPILENVFDKNYRTMGSGTEAPGAQVMLLFAHGF